MSAVTEMCYRESRIKESELPRGPSSIRAQLLGRNLGGPIAVLLPPMPQGSLLAGDVVGRRRSVREYTSEPVNLSQLSAMLHCAWKGDVNDWMEEDKHLQPLTFAVLAWRVEGIEPAVYIYDPQHHALRFLHAASSPDQRVDLFVQKEFADASAVVWIFGNLAAACASRGAFGHRQLLLRAGAAGHRVWMAASGVGLGGCLLGGVVPGEACRQFGVDGYTTASLFAFATGYGAQGPK
jgi:nitroreductase